MRTKSVAVWTAVLALGAAGLACRSTPPAAAGAAAPAGKMVCFNSREISTFAPLPGPYLYVRVGMREHFLLTLDRDSEGLRSAMHIMISPGFDQVCSGTRTQMTYDYLGHVGVYDIIGVLRVKSRKEAEALAAGH